MMPPRGRAGTRRAIVHIGAPRTGSTTVQTLLDRHRQALARDGIVYPDLVPASASHRHINHQHLGETLDGRRPRAERRDLLQALGHTLDTTEADVAILSYERLYLLPPWRRAPARLADLFDRHGFAMEVLLTVRPQAGAVQSHYAWRCQFMREGRPFVQTFDRDLGNGRLDYAARSAPWIDAAGGRVTAVPLRDPASSEPLALRIIAALGLGERIGPLLTPEDLAQAENRSLNAAVIEISRRLRHGGAFIRDNGAARAVVDFIDDAVRIGGIAAPRFQGVDRAMLARAETRFERANDRFARRVWGTTWASRVAPDRIGPITEFARLGAALPPETEDALAGIVAAARRHFDLAGPDTSRALVANAMLRLRRVFAV